MNRPTCDTCSTQLIDQCCRCGAPQCCPLCCQRSTFEEIEAAKDKRIASLEQDAARYKRERDGLRASIAEALTALDGGGRLDAEGNSMMLWVSQWDGVRDLLFNAIKEKALGKDPQ